MQNSFHAQMQLSTFECKTLSIVRIQHLDFLGGMLMNEVEAAADEWALFVDNGVGVRLGSAFMKLATPQYLNNTLGSLVREVCASPSGYEVDANKLEQGIFFVFLNFNFF